MWRVVRQQRVDAVGLRVDGVHGQLLPEGLLFSAVGKPVVDAHLCDQIRAQALSFGGGHASLETLGSAGHRQARWEVSGRAMIEPHFEEGVASPAPVALLHQRFPLLLAGVLLPLVGLIEDLLRRRPPLETVASNFLAGGFAANILAWLSGGVILWEKVHGVLIGFVCHSAARPVRCLIKLCKKQTNKKIYIYHHDNLLEPETNQKLYVFYRISKHEVAKSTALPPATHHRLRPSM